MDALPPPAAFYAHTPVTGPSAVQAQFNSARNAMLSRWRDVLAEGHTDADFIGEIEATAAAMRHLRDLAKPTHGLPIIEHGSRHAD